MEGSVTIPSHIEDLTKCMYELQQDGTFCDAGLECKDGVIFVHKLVLMACRSPYLRNQLASESKGERVYVSLKNYSLKTVCCLVQTLYTGQLNISQENEVDFSHLCETIGLDNIKSAAENIIQQDRNIYEVESMNPFCAVQVEEEIIESQDGITALVASVNHGPDDNLVDSTNTVDNVEDLNYDNSDLKVGSDMAKRSQDSKEERDAEKSLDLPTGRETRSNKRRKIFHNDSTSQAKDNATSSNVADILAIAKQLSGIEEAQTSKPATSCLDQTKSSLCSLCKKEFVNEEENVTDPSKTVCTECIDLFSGETNDDHEMGTKPDQTQNYYSEDGGEDSQKDRVDLEEECLKKTCEERSPLPDLISLEEGDSDPLTWLQEQIDIDGCENNEIYDRKLRNKNQSDKVKRESGETNHEKLWHCKKCEFSTGDKKEQERHRKHHSYMERKLRMSKLCEPPKYSCDECGNEYKSEDGLIKHQNLVHSGKPILRCVLRGCKSRFVEESVLQKHLLWHKSQGVLKCRKCAQEKEKVTEMNYEEKMIIAYEAVVSKRMSFKEACTKFKIPDSTLRDRVKKGNTTKGRRGQNATLDQNQSEKLTKCIMMLLKQGYNYTIDELCTLSSQYAVSLGKRKHDKPVTKHWLYLLCDNFPKLKELRVKLAQMDRTQTRDLTRVSSFFSYLYSCVNKHGLSDKPGSIYSFSSTELSYSWPYAIREVPSHQEAITLFICANGAGKVIPPWYVFPEAKSKVDIKRLQEDCKPGFGFPAEEKLFPSEIFLKYLRTHFLRHTLPQDQKILLVDGHDLYVSVEILEWAEQNQITLIVLPADENKTIQPLQVDCLSAFERMFTDNCKASVSGSQLERSALCKAVSDAYQHAFTCEEIQRSFRMSKIFPIHTEMI